MSDIDKIIIPEHYKLLTSQLKPIIRELQGALINRPIPKGKYIEDISLLTTLWLNPLEKIIQQLASQLNELGRIIMPDNKPTEFEVRNYVQSVSQQLKDLISVFHGIWSRPFHPTIADGQFLISAIPERVLRECLNAFEKIVDIVENPQEIRQKYGSFNVNLKIIFGDEEIKMFERWVSEKKLKFCAIPDKKYTFTHLAIAFLFGWWLGDD